MAENEQMMQYYVDKTAVLINWKGQGEHGEVAIRNHLRTYHENMYEAVGSVAESQGARGWHIARDAIYFYLQYRGMDTSACDHELQAWMNARSTPNPHPVFGNLEPWFEEMDGKYSTTHFTDFKNITLLFHYNDPAQAHTVHEILQKIAQGECTMQDVTPLQTVFDGVRQETEEWVTELYKEKNPQRVGTVKERVAPGGDYDNIEKQERLKLNLLLKYYLDEYLEVTTWSAQFPETPAREAFIEFINVYERDATGGSMTNLLDGQYCQVDPMTAVRHLVEVDGLYKEQFESHIAAGLFPLFPPWRNPDYPLDVIDEKQHKTSTRDALTKLKIPTAEELPQGFAAKQFPALPYRRPRDVYDELRKGAISAPAAPSAAPVPQQPAPPRTAGDGEAITAKDLAEPAPEGVPVPTRWDGLLAEIAERTKALPEDPTDLEFADLDGIATVPEEKEGWLCFQKPAGKDVLHVVGSRYGKGQEALCRSCSSRVLASQKAVWSNVDAAQASGEEPPMDPEVKEGNLEVLRPATGPLASVLGKGKLVWKKQWVRATDTGIHYYASDKDKSAKKADGSQLLTEDSKLVEHPSMEAHEELQKEQKKTGSQRYFYFGFNISAEQHFWMRAADNEEKRKWCAFFKKRLERFGMHDERRDPNPAKWKARVKGLLAKVDDARSVAQAVAAEAERAQLQKAQVMEIKTRAEAEREWAKTEAASAEERAQSLKDEVIRTDQECEGILREVESVKEDTKLLLEQAERYKEQTKYNISEADRQRELAIQIVKQLEAELEEVQKERDLARQETRAVYAKWRRTEERAPTTSVRRSETRSGLLFSPLKSPQSPSYY
eukprot:TRINITY_DN28106_c0_g1_i1.p1 TRINITY_DN28106_c0_g1~~TRINITY_DN28106_c0_g1_i1.p1  ORF type:complete len:835 (+),score=309.72 TRINITY_DN28106_c0_g1_i1:91-2595(+)